jgi:purine-nucleoside phosphorylase
MRYITPEAVMRRRFGDSPRPQWDAAVLCFRSHEGSRLIAQTLGAEPLGYKVLWGMDEVPGYPLAHEFTIGKVRMGLIARCLWGGPQTAILVKELARFGVRHIVGIGAAGSISADLPRGTQVIAASALTTDGTSRAYTDAVEMHVNPDIYAVIQQAERAHPWHLRPVKVATIDAIYRETDSLIQTLAEHGAEVVNMEITPLYAASAVCGVESVWIGHISDCLVNRKWEPWDDLEQMTAQSARIGLDILHSIFNRG